MSNSFFGGLLLILFTTSILSTSVFADESDLATYDLTLAGYRLGMSYDDASLVRPFHMINNLQSKFDDPEEQYTAIVDQAFINDVEMNIKVVFIEQRIRKIIARFSPDFLEDVANQLLKIYGGGDDKSRIIQLTNGEESLQMIYQWDFPGGRINLVGISTNTNHAFLSLVKRQDMPPVWSNDK